jgi:hypothetical protein
VSDSLLIPEGACLVHVGPFKTGSSAIQAALANARPALPEHGVVYPGRGTRDRRAGWAVLGTRPRGRPVPTPDEWDTFAAEVRAHADKRVCISNEDFGRAGAQYVERIVEDLGRDRVHAVIVARRLDKLLPSQWQERVRCYEELTYEQFLEVVLAEGEPTSPAAKAFWQSHDLAAVIDRWASQVGPGRVTVVVTENADRELLPRTFEEMLGLPQGFLQLDSRSNPSVSYNAIELHRRVNEAFRVNGWPDDVYHHLMQNGVNRAVQQVGPTTDETMPPLPDWAADRVRELSVARVDALRQSGAQVVGDADALIPGDLTTVPSDALPDRISVDAAVRSVEGAVRGALVIERRARKEAQRAAAHRSKQAQRAKRRAPVAVSVSPRTVEEMSGREILGEVLRRGTTRVRRSFAGSRAQGGAR